MKCLYEYKDTYFTCKCYMNDMDEIKFETNSCGIDLQYTLSGHYYEPVLYAECNVPRYSFEIHGGLWFPMVHDHDDRIQNPLHWRDFCEKLSDEINLRVAWLHNLPDEYEVNFSIIKPRGHLLFKVLELSCCYFPIRNINSRYLEPALYWYYPNFPEDNVRVVGGGFPGEYYIMISELTVEQKLMIRTKNGEHIVKKKKSYNERMNELMGVYPHVYELKKDLQQANDLFSPTSLVSNYDGFIKKTLKNKEGNYFVVNTPVEGIMFGRNLFVGSFRYDENENFQEIELSPILTPRYNDNVADEHEICKESILREGTRIGRFLVNLHEYHHREEGTGSMKLFHTTIKIQKHPFFKELEELLEDSTMSVEDITNNMIQIETLLDKYKGKL